VCSILGMKTLKQVFRDAALFHSGWEGRSVGSWFDGRNGDAYQFALESLTQSQWWGDEVQAFHTSTDIERRMFFLFLSEAQ
jgi:hypothetical protein